MSLSIQAAKNVFLYLAEYTQLRMREQKTMESWDVSWASGWPSEPEIGSVFQPQHGELGAGVFLNVKKPRRIPNPVPPSEIAAWFETKNLADSTQDAPRVRSVILVQTDVSESENESPGEPIRVRLEDDPAVLEGVKRFIVAAWSPWAETDRSKLAVQALYSKLFSWWQSQSQVGEQWEVLLALGTLTWVDANNSDKIKRPLIVVPALVDMDPSTGSISVIAQPDGAGTTLELDMIPADQRPSAESLRKMRRLVDEAIGDVWERAVGNGVLQGLANSLGPECQYDEGDVPLQAADGLPRVSFAPSLAVRKRTEKSIHSLLRKISEQLGEGETLPPGIAAVLGVERATSEDVVPTDEARPEGPYDPSSGIVYFPKKSNDEQRTIVGRLERSRGGLIVQGPPGTGKSHTIANLVCHLLATGNRVLVTSKGRRALGVLRGMLPEEIQDLCVLLLDSDHESRQSLETSIRSISERYDSWQPSRAAARKEQLVEEYHKRRVEGQALLGKILEVRQAETQQNVAVAGVYEGTLSEIAAKLRSEEQTLGWIRDLLDGNIEDPGDCPVIQAECTRAAQDVQGISSELWEELQLVRPSEGVLSDLGDFRRLIGEEESARAELAACTVGNYHIVWSERLTRVQESVSTLQLALRSLVDSGKYAVSTADLLRECVDGDSEIVREEADYIADVVLRVGSQERLDCELKVPEGIAPAQVRADGLRLIAHFRAGKGLGIGPIRAKVVRECQYLLRDTRIDGSLCCDIDTLVRLVEAIETEQLLQSTAQRLARHELITGGSQASRLANLRVMSRRLNAVLDVASPVPGLRQEVADLDFGFVPNWGTSEGLGEIAGVLRQCASRAALERATERIDSAEAAVRATGTPIHPTCLALATAIANRDRTGVEAALSLLRGLSLAQSKLDSAIEVRTAVANRSEILAQSLFAWGDPNASERLSQLDGAWSWLRADRWLRRVSDPTRNDDLAAQLEMNDARLGRTVSSLAAELAWGHCLSAMTEDHRRHLVAWQLAMRKLGKGTGKYAAVHRSDAREHMQDCKDVVPAWIMPLHKVAETLDPGPGVFDVAIIDEASQSGPEALFVAYIAKKVIIVGDDQQISPDDVGINEQTVRDLIDLYLDEMPFKGVFGAKSSLFDQGKQFFGHPVRLREHFRCMPEIIQFSNGLCYADQPLEPLRQYGADRLKPIEVRYVRDAVQEDGKGKVNHAEAQAIVDEITRLCNDPRYEGLTMGVISLLSSSHQAQHINMLLLKQLGTEQMKRRRIVCGDAYEFQGDERDVIFLSMVSAPNHRIGALNKEADKRRFNVAVSRAKNQLWLFHSARLEELSHTCYRRRLLDYCMNPQVTSGDVMDDSGVEGVRRAASGFRSLGTQPTPFDSWFEVDVFLRISDRGYRVIPQFESGGYFIDLMIQGMNGALAVECDGEHWHGVEQFEADLERQRKLERCGLRFWRVRESEFRRDPDAAMESLWNRLEELGIRTGSDEIEPHEIPGPELNDISRVAFDEDAVFAELVFEETPEAQATLDAPSDAAIDTWASLDLLGTLGATDQNSALVGTVAEDVPVSHDGLGLRDYAEWEPHRLADPRNGFQQMIQAGLLEILQAEGPILVDRLYRQYARGASISRVKAQIRANLDSALSSLARTGAVLRKTEYVPGAESENLIYLAGKPDVAVRKRGPRDLEEVPLTEILELMRRLTEKEPESVASIETTVRRVQDLYEISRLGVRVNERLTACAEKCLRGRH